MILLLSKRWDSTQTETRKKQYQDKSGKIHPRNGLAILNYVGLNNKAEYLASDVSILEKCDIVMLDICLNNENKLIHFLKDESLI